MKNLQFVSSRFKEIVNKKSPTLLTAAAVGGAITTVVLAVRATPKAVSILDAELSIRDPEKYTAPDVVDIPDYFTKKEIVQLCYREYIPSMIMGGVTIGCIIGSNAVNHRRQAALASLYSIADTSLKEYQTRVKEKLGDNKYNAINDEISKDMVKNNPPEDNKIFLTGKGDVTCLDGFSGRYFKSDYETIRKVVNDLTELLFLEDFVPLNSFYHEIGLDPITHGEDSGWSSEHGTIKFHYSSQLHDGVPILVINYDIGPYALDVPY